MNPNDITYRLRHECPIYRGGKTQALREEAADEIDRLRKKIEQLEGEEDFVKSREELQHEEDFAHLLYPKEDES